MNKPPATAALGRPRQFSPDAALEKAMRIFWKRGFEATSMDDLESGTGLSRSSLYNAFGSKRALFERAMDRYGRERDGGLLAALEHGAGGLDDVHAFLEGLAQALSTVRFRRGCFMVNTMIEFGGADAALTRKGSAFFDRVQRAFSAALKRAAARGEIAAEGIDDRARLLLAIAMGMNVQARAGRPRGDLLRLAKIARAQAESWRAPRAGRLRRARR